MATKKPMLVIAIGKAPAGKKNGVKTCPVGPNKAKCTTMGKCMNAKK